MINKKKKSKFEKTQSYRIHKKPNKLLELANKFRNELLDLETPAEVIFKSYLIKFRIKYEFQRILFAGKSFYVVDFFIPRKKIVFEVDGFHHSTGDKLIQDQLRTLDLKEIGVKEVYRFTNDEVFDYGKCISKLKNILDNGKETVES